jgi:hypothetical protein
MYGYMRPRRRSSFFGALFAAAFGVFWTLTAARAGAPGFFVVFGIVFIVASIVGGISHLLNGGGNGYRSMSRFNGGYSAPMPGPNVAQPAGYCPSCGATRPRPFRFCPNCGKPSGQL